MERRKVARTVEEILKLPINDADYISFTPDTEQFWLREIAAQLAALNQHVEFLCGHFAVESVRLERARNPWKPKAPRIKPK